MMVGERLWVLVFVLIIRLGGWWLDLRLRRGSWCICGLLMGLFLLFWEFWWWFWRMGGMSWRRVFWFLKCCDFGWMGERRLGWGIGWIRKGGFLRLRLGKIMVLWEEVFCIIVCIISVYLYFVLLNVGEWIWCWWLWCVFWCFELWVFGVLVFGLFF